VTGTFGGTDFIHSLLGEATDKISQVSLTDLDSAVSDAEMQSTEDTFSKLKNLMKMFPSGQSDLDKIQDENSENKGKKLHLPGMDGEGDTISVDEISKKIYTVMEFRDNLMKKIAGAMEMVRSQVNL
jgi:hypothetical protein